MGSLWSSTDKKVDQTGEVNNNITVEATVDATSLEIVVLLSIICVIKVLEFIYLVFKAYNRGLKKKYLGS